MFFEDEILNLLNGFNFFEVEISKILKGTKSGGWATWRSSGGLWTALGDVLGLWGASWEHFGGCWERLGAVWLDSWQ